MLCPHCGNEVSEEAHICDHCGGIVSAGVNWGVRKPSNTYRPHYSSDTEKLTNFVAATPALHKTKPRALKVASIIATLALVLGAIGAGGYLLANADNTAQIQREQEQEENKAGRWHDVIVAVSATGLDDNGSLIPIQVTGADASGKAYDEVAYIKPNGTGLRLQAGKYGIHPLASPITSEGRLFLFNTANKWFSIGTELESGSRVDVSSEVELSFDEADPLDLSADAINEARKYAIEGGMSAERVDELLKSLQASVEESKEGAAFSSVQTYRNYTFVGDVRTNTGFVPASGIPDVHPILTRTNMFLFTGSKLFYADNATSTDTTSQIALHSRNMTTGQESILATDLASNTTPHYINGQVIYTAYEWGTSIKRIDVASGETSSVSEALPWEFSKLVGVTDGFIVTATADGQMPQLYFMPLGEGEQHSVALGSEAGNVVGVFDDLALVAISGWDYSKLAVYGLDGTLKWEKDVEGGASLGTKMLYQDNALYASSANGTQLICVDFATEGVKVFDSNVAYLFGPMIAKDGYLYFAGSNEYASYDETGTAAATYTTYELNLNNGQMSDMGAYEAPQDEDLAAQQQYMYWDNLWGTGTWNSTGTETWNSTGTGTGTWDSTGTGTWDSTGTGTGTWDSTGTETGTWDNTGTGTWDGTGTGY